MLPEGLGRLVVALPVLLHVAEGVGLAGGLEERLDVVVFTRRVAVGLVGAVTVVGPGWVSTKL